MSPNNLHTQTQNDQTTYDEQTLIRRCQKRDKTAFMQLEQRYQEAIFTYVYQHVSDRRRASDLTRRIFVAAYKTFPQFRHNLSVKAWLLTIANHHLHPTAQPQPQRWLASFLRRPQTHPEQPTDDNEPTLPVKQDECGTIRPLLSAYLDGALSDQESKRVAEHLHRCSACCQEYDELSETVEMVQMFGRVPVPPELRVQIAAELEQIHSFRERLARLFPFSSTQVIAVAASLAMFFGILVYYQQFQLLQKFEEQRQLILRGSAEGIESGMVKNTFVVLTGSKDMQVSLLDDARALSDIIATPPQQTALYFSSLPLKELEKTIEEKIPELYGTIKDDIRITKPGFHIRKILVDLPANSSQIISALFQELQPEQPGETLPQTISITILLIEKIE